MVRVRGRGALGRQRLFVQAGAQHGLDRAVGVSAYGEGAGASRFQVVRAERSPRRTMPRHVRKPCSGWGRLASTASASLAVAGPAWAAHETMRDGVQAA